MTDSNAQILQKKPGEPGGEKASLDKLVKLWDARGRFYESKAYESMQDTLPTPGTVALQCARELEAVVAGALAACALEARLDEQTNYPATHRHSASLQQDYARLIADCPRCKRIAALERAAEDKA